MGSWNFDIRSWLLSRRTRIICIIRDTSLLTTIQNKIYFLLQISQSVLRELVSTVLRSILYCKKKWHPIQVDESPHKHKTGLTAHNSNKPVSQKDIVLSSFCSVHAM